MIALLLFIFGIYCFEQKQDRVTFYFILQFLAMAGYAMLSWDREFVRMDDLALIMLLYSFFRAGIYQKSNVALVKVIYIYLAVVLLSTIVSFIYYQIPIVQILKGIRTSLYVLVFFDLKNMRTEEFHRLFYRIFLLTSFASGLFCFECLTGITPTIEIRGPGFLGLPRSYNCPPLVSFTCLYSVFVMDRKKKLFYPLLLLSFMTLFIIQSRGMIMVVLLTTALGLSLKASASNRIYISILAAGMSVFLISSLIFGGDTGDTTMNDFNKIASGEFASANFEDEGDATFTYRLNILAISVTKNCADPIRFFFGSGLVVEMPYSFFERWEMVECCRFSINDYTYFTPDITFSNVIYNIGIMGLFVYMTLIGMMLNMMLKWAEGKNGMEIVGAMFILYLLLIALDSSILTWPNYLIVPFFFVQYVCVKHEADPSVKLLLFLLLLKSALIRRRGALGEVVIE